MIPAVDARSITVRRGGTTLVDHVDLKVSAGDWCTIVGPNGAGKSTLLGAIAGVIPRHGTVHIQGIAADGLDHRARARVIAFVVQQPVIPRGVTVDQFVLLGRTPHSGRLGRLGQADHDATALAIERLGLRRLATRRLDSLSGGERQRAVIARAVVQEAPVLLLDEPTTALDIGFQQDVLDVVDGLRSELGLTVVSVMHDLTLAAQYADQLTLLAGGRVVATGDPTELLAADTLRDAFGARLDVLHHNGRTIVAPLRRSRRVTPPTPNREKP